MRKAQDDLMARTEAERVVGDELEATGLINSEVHEPTAVGKTLLDRMAKTVEFETGTSKDPDRNTVPMRRLVITGPWTVDPDGIAK